MKITKLNDYTKGWVVGDFDPTLLKTEQFEVAVKKYTKGDAEATHMHKIATEVTIISGGSFRMNESILREGDVVLLEPREAASFLCLEDGHTTVIKIPSVKGDKYII